MKLLFLTEFFPADKKLNFTGGVEARTYFTAKYLTETNKVMVICRRTDRLLNDKSFYNINVFPCGLPAKYIEASFLSVFERIFFMFNAFFKALSLEFDVIEGSNFVTYLPAFFSGWLKRKKTIAWYADILSKKWFQYFGLSGIFGFLTEEISLRLPWSKIIALSRTTADKLVKKGIKEKKIEIIHGGIRSEEYLKKRRQKKLNIICVARLVKYKRIEDLICAFSKLGKEFPLLTLTIVGQGPEEKKLRESAKKTGFEKRIYFHKNLDRRDLITKMSSSYLFCSASMIEGFGLTIIEALAAGTPYVVSNIKTHQEITENAKGGLIFKKGDIDDLAKKLRLLLLDKKLYQDKLKKGQELIKKYCWEKIADKTEKVYDNLINGKI